jgi:hypothetical protein
MTSKRGPRRIASRLARRVGVVAVVLTLTPVAVSTAAAQEGSIGDAHTSQTDGGIVDFIVRTLDGSNNNRGNPTWGQAGTQYSRVAEPNYADGYHLPVTGESPRYVSNRIFADTGQNLFSENSVSQWGFVWGQFLDHTFGLRDEAGEEQPIPYDGDDPLEAFENDFGVIGFSRSAASPGTGTGSGNPRQQTNTLPSYIDAFAVYGGSQDRLEWLREGPVDGNLSNNSARLLLPDDDLPTVGARGDANSAPTTAIDGRLRLDSSRARVAGDVRVSENIALQGTHTLFAREHNRIVDQLPPWLPESVKFEIARKVVSATQQFITYTEFLPAIGIELPSYRGYNRNVNVSLSNEFATVGYRGHSMIHGEFEPIGEVDDYTAEELEALEAQGIEVEIDGDEIEFVVPLNIAFFNPDLVPALGLDAVMRGLGGEPQYKNDEQIDDQLRSVLFEVPAPGQDPSECPGDPPNPACFQGVTDLGAIDIERGRDHGMPSYNELRQAYGLAPVSSFTEITGEATEEFPTDDPEIDLANPLDDPDILDFVALFDADGNPIALDSEEADSEAVTGVRRTTLAARLKAIYGDVNNVDAFVGMVSEQHLPGKEFGALQNAIWTREFRNLRDSDRFFYQNDPGLSFIRSTFSIDFRQTLADVIVNNTDLEAGDIAENVFISEEEEG